MKGGKRSRRPVHTRTNLKFGLISSIVSKGGPNESVKTTDISNIYTNNASGFVVLGFYEAVCRVGTAWDVFVLQVQPISATAAGTEPA